VLDSRSRRLKMHKPCHPGSTESNPLPKPMLDSSGPYTPKPPRAEGSLWQAKAGSGDAGGRTVSFKVARCGRRHLCRRVGGNGGGRVTCSYRDQVSEAQRGGRGRTTRVEVLGLKGATAGDDLGSQRTVASAPRTSADFSSKPTARRKNAPASVRRRGHARADVSQIRRAGRRQGSLPVYRQVGVPGFVRRRSSGSLESFSTMRCRSGNHAAAEGSMRAGRNSPTALRRPLYWL